MVPGHPSLQLIDPSTLTDLLRRCGVLLHSTPKTRKSTLLDSYQQDRQLIGCHSRISHRYHLATWSKITDFIKTKVDTELSCGGFLYLFPSLQTYISRRPRRCDDTIPLLGRQHEKTLYTLTSSDNMEREYIEGVDPGMQPGMESGMRSPTSKDVGDVVEEPMAAPVYRDREISAVEAQEDLGKFARNHMVFILYPPREF